MMQSLREKAVELVVGAILVGALGYLVGNSEAMMMRAQIERLQADGDRRQRAIEGMEARLDALQPRIDRLDARIEMEREERVKGDSK